MAIQQHESLLIQLAVALVAIGTFYFILNNVRKKTNQKSFHQEYDEILTSDKYKVKGRFE